MVAELRGRAGDTGQAAAGPSAGNYWKALDLARAVQRTLKLAPLDDRCLMQSLVLTALLARRGIASTLHIAVKPGDEFKAHAWVEYFGSTLLPGAGEPYESLTQL